MILEQIAAPEYDVDFDIAYATAQNFTGHAVYARPGCYLHPDAAACLKEAIRLAAAIGYRLLIFDAYRPSEAQWRLWSHSPDPDFLADPRRGSPHSRGVAIDLTLLDATGNRLEMGTEFDDFTPKAHHGNQDVSVAAQKNRLILLGLMTAAGWDFYRNEWWHYQLFNSRRYPLLSDSAAATQMMV